MRANLPIAVCTVLALFSGAAHAEDLIMDCKAREGLSGHTFVSSVARNEKPTLTISTAVGYKIPVPLTFSELNIQEIAPALLPGQQAKPGYQLMITTNRIEQSGGSYRFWSLWYYPCDDCRPQVAGHWENRAGAEAISELPFECVVRRHPKDSQ